jgi:hypothetical protein
MLLATQIENGNKSKISLIDIEKACFEGEFDMKIIMIKGRPN